MKAVKRSFCWGSRIEVILGIHRSIHSFQKPKEMPEVSQDTWWGREICQEKEKRHARQRQAAYAGLPRTRFEAGPCDEFCDAVAGQDCWMTLFEISRWRALRSRRTQQQGTLGTSGDRRIDSVPALGYGFVL